MKKFRDLREKEIDVRIGQVGQGYATLLLYKDARADMDILDETVNPENWQRKHYAVKDNMYCSVGIKCGDEWVWKDDCGTESNTEKEKGEASDSFKRACVNWGIGRELYTAGLIYINCETDGKKVKGLKDFSVDSITTTDGIIKALTISAYNTELKKRVEIFRKASKENIIPDNTLPKHEQLKPVSDLPLPWETPEFILNEATKLGYTESDVIKVIKALFNKNNLIDLTGSEITKLLARMKKEN